VHRPRSITVVLLAATAGLAACASTTSATSKTFTTSTTSTTSTGSAAAEVNAAGDIPDNQAFVTYAPPGAAYSIKVPEGWARATDGAATTFTDKYNTIRIETIAAATAPTAASVTSTDLAAIAGRAKGYVAGKVSVVARAAGQAVLAIYQVDAPPNAVTTKAVRLDVERYVFWKNGTAAIVTLSSASGSDNVDPWRTVTDGFGWV
jgi:hypothetical protein